MAARRGNMSRGRRDDYAAPRPDAVVPEHVREFQRGLFPILVAGDVDAFRRYLSRWEEVIGDTADLGQLPPAEQRSLMARLLRRPQLYNLPVWPADLADAVAEAETTEKEDAAGNARPSIGARTIGDWPPRELPGSPAAVARGQGSQPATGSRAGTVPRNAAALAEEATVVERPPPLGAQSLPPESQPATDPEPEPAHASYQLDMLTGELVPVSIQPARVTEAAAGYGAEPARQAKRRTRRRRPPPNLVQLAFWPDEQK